MSHVTSHVTIPFVHLPKLLFLPLIQIFVSHLHLKVKRSIHIMKYFVYNYFSSPLIELYIVFAYKLSKLSSFLQQDIIGRGLFESLISNIIQLLANIYILGKAMHTHPFSCNWLFRSYKMYYYCGYFKLGIL